MDVSAWCVVIRRAVSDSAKSDAQEKARVAEAEREALVTQSELLKSATAALTRAETRADAVNQQKETEEVNLLRKQLSSAQAEANLPTPRLDDKQHRIDTPETQLSAEREQNGRGLESVKASDKAALL